MCASVCVLSLKLLDRGTGCLRGLMSLRWTSDSWIGLFSLPLPGGFAVSSILRQIVKREINGQWGWRKGKDIERGRGEKRTRGGQLPSAHFLLMDKANSRRQCCRQIWIFFITWTHALICWGWQRQKHGYFFFYSGLLPSILLFFFYRSKCDLVIVCLAFRLNVSWFLFFSCMLHEQSIVINTISHF